MKDPLQLHSRLADLLEKIQAHNQSDATALATALVDELDGTNAALQAQIAGAAPVRFSALHHALAREIRGGQRAVAEENWAAAAKSIRVAISILPM